MHWICHDAAMYLSGHLALRATKAGDGTLDVRIISA
jgi:hypothetical protein